MSSLTNDPKMMDSDPAMNVWAAFGSNAVPFLAKELETRDGPVKKA